MFQLEKKFWNFVRRYIFWAFAAFALVASVLARVYFFPIRSSDMEIFLLPWVEEFREGGFAALYTHSANYNVAYLLVLYLLSCLKVNPVFSIKIVSVLFDYVLALGMALLVAENYARKSKKKRVEIATIVFLAASFLPSLVLNSAYWGQCDSIYTAFCIWAVYAALKDKWPAVFVLYGLALSFKLQAIFLLPALILWYVSTRRFSVWQFLLSLGVFCLPALPVAIHNGELGAAFKAYTGQVENGRYVYVNYHGVGSFFAGREFEYFGRGMLLFILVLFFGALVWVLAKQVRPTKDGLLLLAGWSVVTCVVFLPGMHERYAYLGEVLLLVWAVRQPVWRHILPAGVFYMVGFAACNRFLLGFWPDHSVWMGLLNVANWVFLTVVAMRELAPASALLCSAGEMHGFPADKKE